MPEITNIKIDADAAFRRWDLADVRTRERLFFYTGTTLVVEVTCLLNKAVGDLSDISTLHFEIKAEGAASADPALVQEILADTDVATGLTQQQWVDGSVHATFEIPADETELAAGKKKVVIWSTHAGGEIITWLSGEILAVDDGGGVAGDPPAPVNQYYTSATSDVRFARANLTNVPDGAVLMRHLEDAIHSMARMDLDPHKFVAVWDPGTNDPVIQAASGNTNEWYYVGAAGTASGTNADGTYTLGDILISDGTDYSVVKAPPANIPDGYIGLAKLAEAVQDRLTKVHTYDQSDLDNLISAETPFDEWSPPALNGHVVVVNEDAEGNPLAHSQWMIWVVYDQTLAPQAGGYIDIGPGNIRIADNAITTDKIIDEAVTEAKLAAGVKAKLDAVKVHETQQELWDGFGSGETFASNAGIGEIREGEIVAITFDAEREYGPSEILSFLITNASGSPDTGGFINLAGLVTLNLTLQQMEISEEDLDDPEGALVAEPNTLITDIYGRLWRKATGSGSTGWVLVLEDDDLVLDGGTF